jgi:hypothetical protein
MADRAVARPTGPSRLQRWFPIGDWLPKYDWGSSFAPDLIDLPGNPSAREVSGVMLHRFDAPSVFSNAARSMPPASSFSSTPPPGDPCPGGW